MVFVLFVVFVGIDVGGAARVAHATSTAAATGAPLPSAIGDEYVNAVAVSPAFQRTGLALAVSTPIGCHTASGCTHLWVSHDGGATWRLAAARNWGGGAPVVAVDGSGRDIVFSGSGAFEYSSDGGDTWHGLGRSGEVTPAPTFAADGTVAIASGDHDFLADMRNRTSRDVAGSGRAFIDLGFAYSPPLASAGAHAFALLSAEDRTTSAPVVERCSADLACSRPVILAGAGSFAPPATLFLSADFARTGAVFARVPGRIYKSTDGGASFAPLRLPADGASSQTIPMMAIAPGYREAGPVRTVYAALLESQRIGSTTRTSGGIIRSSDGGATWTHIGSPSPLDAGATAIVAAPGGRLFAAYLSAAGSGLLCSDDGATWQATCSPIAGSAGGSSAAAPATGSAASGCPASACPWSAGRGGTSAGGAAVSGQGEPGAVGEMPAQSRFAVAPANGSHGLLVLLVAAIGLVSVALLGVVWRARRRAGA